MSGQKWVRDREDREKRDRENQCLAKKETNIAISEKLVFQGVADKEKCYWEVK